MKKGGMIIFLLYLILGLYFINYPFNFIKIPEFIFGLNNWIIFIGGILMIVGSINYLKASKSSS